MDIAGFIGLNISPNLITYAPEVWLALLMIVLGTLIIVISIASQTTPKLIELYIGDFRSLFYIWIITLASFENIYVQFSHEIDSVYLENVAYFNIYFILPVAILFAIPYIFYILSYTKTSNVIKIIYNQNLRIITGLGKRGRRIKQEKTQIYQSLLFNNINQMDDLLQYVQFKEPKGDIISKLGETARIYNSQKHNLPGHFFFLSDKAKEDISFKTLKDKFKQIEADKTFYEYKIFRVLGSAYQNLIEDRYFNLASLVGSELMETGKASHLNKNDTTVELVLVQFNTLLRYGIKDGLKTREMRSLYDTIFHYGQLVSHFIEQKDEAKITKCCKYLSYYGAEVYELRFVEKSFEIMVDAFAVELQAILIALHKAGFDKDLQYSVIKLFNDIDPPRDEKKIQDDRLSREGVRIIKISLCLYYLNQEEQEFFQLVLGDILEDLGALPSEKVMDLIEKDCQILHESSPAFWEDTDRGNRNIYSTENKDQISGFFEIVKKQLLVS